MTEAGGPPTLDALPPDLEMLSAEGVELVSNIL
jgi:hypothetical protein